MLKKTSRDRWFPLTEKVITLALKFANLISQLLCPRHALWITLLCLKLYFTFSYTEIKCTATGRVMSVLSLTKPPVMGDRH